MVRVPRSPESPDELLGRLLRQASEPFVSLVDVAGFPVAILTIVRSARRMIEANPALFGEIAATGVRDEGAVWFIGEAAEAVRVKVGHNHREGPGGPTSLVPARVFAMIAYRHPYFDANKRTAFLAATLTAYYLGFEIRPVPFARVEEEVRSLTAREASEEEVADWFTRKIFISPDRRGYRE